MHSISDFPAFFIDQIIGTNDTSYVAVKLWLCGDSNLNDKLSKGLTLLELKCHPLSQATLPQMVTQLRSLRRLSLQSNAPLLHHLDDWPAMMRSFPNTLESLAIHSHHDYNACTKALESRTPSYQQLTVTYSRGESTHIELETLFPHLHTLILASGVNDDHENIDADLFAVLPASLTRLEAPILVTTTNSHYFSKLPPSLTHLLGGSLNDCYHTQHLMKLRAALANVPSTLQNMKIERGDPCATDEEMSEKRWLPKSLLKVHWTNINNPSWLPSDACIMPPSPHTLVLGSTSDDLFVDEGLNWVAELPRTLTKLTIKPDKDYGFPIDFASYARSLPPNLTSLNLFASHEYPDFGMYGNWSAISGADFWPSNLAVLRLLEFCIAPSDVANLPRTLTRLEMTIYSDQASQGSHKESILDTSELPPNLTWLDLGWTPEVEVCLSLTKFKLKVCILYYWGSSNLIVPSWNLPDSIELLHLSCITYDPTTDLPSSLNHLEVSHAHCDVLNNLPRGLISLGIVTLDGIDESPLVATGQLFKHLPPSVTAIHLYEAVPNAKPDFELPAQELSHLPLLKHLELKCTPRVSSRILRNLPRTLKTLKINITQFDEDDLPYLPPQLETCIVPKLRPTLASCMSLRSLARLHDAKDVSSLVIHIAKRRVLQASQYQ